MKRTLLLLAKTYNGQDLTDYFYSEKFNGQRAFWDGGTTTGHPKQSVPWANTSNPEHISTGLWSRYGNVIHAPKWFTAQLPSRVFLDGELYINRATKLQELRSIISRYDHTEDWSKVRYYFFDRPLPHQFLQPGLIDNPNHTRYIKPQSLNDEPELPYHELYPFLARYESDIAKRILQFSTSGHCMETTLAGVVSQGGEGLMLRHKQSVWEPRRASWLLKMKPKYESTGTVVSSKPGKGRLEGVMGSLLIKWEDKSFNISGFTDEERSQDWPVGTAVMFTYRDKTLKGVPIEARYKRDSA